MRSLSHVVLALAVAGSAHAQSPAFDAAVRTMGGKDRLLAVRTLATEGTAENLSFGQNHTPFAETRFEVTSWSRVYDFANRRWFHDQTRVPRFNTANTAPQRQRFGLDGWPNGVAYNIGPNDVMARGTAQSAEDRMMESMFHPIGFVMAAYSPGTEISEEQAGNLRRVRINPMGLKLAMYVDPQTSLPVRIERIMYQPMLGDVAFNTELSDWRDVSGLKLPMRLTQRYETLFTVADYRLTNATVNGAVGNLAATDSVRAVVLPAAQPAAPTIIVDTIAPGVWSVAGQSHHTIAIEQSGSLVLVEAPQNEARTLAAIDAARALRPNKPATLLINTHHHFDHAGGLRAAIAQGFTIVTHDANREFYERIVFPRRHFIQADRLAQSPKPMRLMPVADRWVRQDSLRPIEVYAVPSDHSGSMLVVYLPNERILIQADLYNPPAANAVNPVFPFARALVEAVERRGLSVDRVVGIHGRPVPWSDVIAASQR
jgi:glyoxylase-like metal-dependent hydrolase (beta-lactamase superfamily II)